MGAPGTDRSVDIGSTVIPYCAWSWDAKLPRRSLERATRTRFAPRMANSWAYPKPMPEDAPVINMVCPSNLTAQVSDLRKGCCGGNSRSTPMEVWEPPRYRQTGRLYRCLHRPHCAKVIFLTKCDRCSHGSSRVGVSARSGPENASNASGPKPDRGSARTGSAPSRRLSIGTGIARTVFETARVRLLPKWMEILDGLIPSNHP